MQNIRYLFFHPLYFDTLSGHHRTEVGECCADVKRKQSPTLLAHLAVCPIMNRIYLIQKLLWFKLTSTTFYCRILAEFLLLHRVLYNLLIIKTQ